MTDEQRVVNNQRDRQAWRERNADAVRAATRKQAIDPDHLQRVYAARRARREEERQALLAAGWVPRPVGRPKLLAPADTPRAPPATSDEERKERARIHRRTYRAKLKISGLLYSPVFGWARPDDEQCSSLKRHRSSAFKRSNIFSAGRENTLSNKDDAANEVIN